MRYWQTTYIGTGSDDDPFRPGGVDDVEGWASIDFRPDPLAIDGVALVAIADDLTLKGATLISDGPTAAVQKGGLGNTFDVTLSEAKFDKVLAELLIEHADDKNPGRWNELKPTHEGRLEVWLGEKLVDLPVVKGGAMFRETFDTADSTTLGPVLTWTEYVSNLQVLSNMVDRAASGRCEGRAEIDCLTDNNYGEIVIGSDSTSTNLWMVACRFSSSADTAYWTEIVVSAGKTNLYRRVTASNTVIVQTNYTKATGDVMRTSADGSTIETLFNAAVYASGTDTNITTGKRCGLALNAGATGRVNIDNFEMGDLDVQYPQVSMV